MIVVVRTFRENWAAKRLGNQRNCVLQKKLPLLDCVCKKEKDRILAETEPSLRTTTIVCWGNHTFVPTVNVRQKCFPEKLQSGINQNAHAVAPSADDGHE